MIELDHDRQNIVYTSPDGTDVRAVRCTTKGFLMVHRIWRANGARVSYEDLYQAIWGPRVSTLDNPHAALCMHLSKVRANLRRAGMRALLVTDRSFGVKLNLDYLDPEWRPRQ